MPLGGAHRAPEVVIQATGEAIDRALASFAGQSSTEIRRARREKFLRMGAPVAS